MYGFATTDELPHFQTQTISDNPFEEKTEPSNRKLSTISGKMQHLCIGGEYEIQAKHKCDKQYGHQYEPVTVFAMIPQTTATQLLFLQSIVPPAIAEELVRAYPNIVNDVVSGELKDIDYTKVRGVQEFTWNRVKDKIFANYIISDIIVMLKPLGVTYVMIKKLLNGTPNPVLLKKQLLENPYIMTRIDGIGFKKADDLALKLKPEMLESVERLTAFIVYYLKDIGESDGHTWVLQSILMNAISNEVPECQPLIAELFAHNTFLYQEGERIGLLHYREIEDAIIDILKRKCAIDTSGWLSDAQILKAISDAETEQGYTYVPEQLEAVYNTLRSTVSVITGKAGTGKTSIMRAVFKAYVQNQRSISACALSAMAAQRITEATKFPAGTIHRTLGCKGINEFQFNKSMPLLANVASMDEGSMVNANLFLKWLEAIGDGTRIVIAGDHKQLPPIGFGNVFSDILDALGDKYVNRLVKPMRQAEKSGILTDANLIRENINPITETIQPKLVHGELQDMYYMFRNNRQSIFDAAIKLYMSAIKNDSIDDVIIAVPRKQGCLNSTQEFNKVIQDLLLGDETEEISHMDVSFKLGVKVMQTVNDYDKNVFNGEVGYITRIWSDTEGKKKVKYCEVTYKDLSMDNQDKVIVYPSKELSQLDMAYAMTVHKLQGAGKKTVIGVIDNTHYKLLDNCMLYTLLTRAKQRCCLLAEVDAFAKCLRTSHNRRNTWMSLKQTGGC